MWQKIYENAATIELFDAVMQNAKFPETDFVY